MRAFSRLADAGSRLALAAAAVCVILLLGLVVFDAVRRYLFTAPTAYGVEYAEYLLVAITFLGAGGTLLRGGHIQMELVIERLGERVRRRWDVAIFLLVAAISAVLAWYALDFALDSRELDARANTTTRTPMWIPQLLPPVGLALLTLTAVSAMARSLLVTDDHPIAERKGTSDGSH